MTGYDAKDFSCGMRLGFTDRGGNAHLVGYFNHVAILTSFLSFRRRRMTLHPLRKTISRAMSQRLVRRGPSQTVFE